MSFSGFLCLIGSCSVHAFLAERGKTTSSGNAAADRGRNALSVQQCTETFRSFPPPAVWAVSGSSVFARGLCAILFAEAYGIVRLHVLLRRATTAGASPIPGDAGPGSAADVLASASSDVLAFAEATKVVVCRGVRRDNFAVGEAAAASRDPVAAAAAATADLSPLAATQRSSGTRHAGGITAPEAASRLFNDTGKAAADAARGIIRTAADALAGSEEAGCARVHVSAARAGAVWVESEALDTVAAANAASNEGEIDGSLAKVRSCAEPACERITECAGPAREIL